MNKEIPEIKKTTRREFMRKAVRVGAGLGVLGAGLEVGRQVTRKSETKITLTPEQEKLLIDFKQFELDVNTFIAEKKRVKDILTLKFKAFKNNIHPQYTTSEAHKVREISPSLLAEYDPSEIGDYINNLKKTQDEFNTRRPNFIFDNRDQLRLALIEEAKGDEDPDFSRHPEKVADTRLGLYLDEILVVSEEDLRGIEEQYQSYRERWEDDFKTISRVTR